MTTLIISSIIALLVIASVALSVARWMHACAERERLLNELSKIDLTKTVEAMQNFARAIIDVETAAQRKADEIAQNKLIEDAKDILKDRP